MAFIKAQHAAGKHYEWNVNEPDVHIDGDNDPKGNSKVQELDLCPGVHLAKSALEAVQDAETLVLATEWPEFGEVDLTEVHHRMHTPIVFDGRNLFDPATMRALGFQYFGIGRPLANSSSRNSNGTGTHGNLLALCSN
jgi:UDP-glucose/GDP-mannose dehydrogenase family, UDP binding domain